MLTTVEFKRIYGLTDSAFKRLVKRVKDEHPNIELTKRQGSTDWIVLRPDLLESALPANPANAIVPASKVEAIELSQKDFISSLKAEALPIMPTFKHVDTSAEVEQNHTEVDNLLNASKQFRNSVLQALAQQAIAEGTQIGSTLAQLQIAAIEREQQQQVANYAKKQGLEEAPASEL